MQAPTVPFCVLDAVRALSRTTTGDQSCKQNHATAGRRGNRKGPQKGFLYARRGVPAITAHVHVVGITPDALCI